MQTAFQVYSSHPAIQNTTYQIIDLQTGNAVSTTYTWAQRNRARNRAEKLNLEYGAHRYTAKPTFAAEA